MRVVTWYPITFNIESTLRYLEEQMINLPNGLCLYHNDNLVGKATRAWGINSREFVALEFDIKPDYKDYFLQRGFKISR